MGSPAVNSLQDHGQQAGSFWIEAVDDVLIVAVTDRAGRILYANDRFCEISGYGHDELVGANHRILNSGHHDRGFFKTMFKTICAGEIWRGEICNRAKDGSLYWVSTTIFPELDEAGEVCRFVSCRFDITEQKNAEQRMREMAVTDALTGLQNRLGFQHRFAQLLSEAQLHRHGLALLMLDIDNFKDINDVSGHDAGDQFLKTMAYRLRTVLGSEALIARPGGDEVAIVLKRTPDSAPLADIVEQLQEAVWAPVQIGPAFLLATASIGLSVYPKDGQCTAELINCADVALYSAKRVGRNRCVRFKPEMLERTRRRVLIQEQAHAGLTAGQFELFYQPIVGLHESGLPSFEALLRWHHPVLGLIAPGVFEEVFESRQLCAEIGTFVQEAVIMQTRAWIDAGIPFAQVKYNTTTADFDAPHFAARLLTLLDRHGVGAERIGIEVTEGMFLGQQSETVRRELHALSNAGVEIAFDDFGTGFASLTHLKELPISRLKIDRSFITNLTSDTRDQKIVHGMIALAHSLGISVTAEGVETSDQMELLTVMGCDRVQGHFHCEAIPAAQVPAVLNRLNPPSNVRVAA
ncbi:putative bifunctional diguanylate cyclase/phosphodiesterase [Novosphingobium mathurense]|uniref:PAS domain S-box-containing protein/diguanylate cyclase (GGDEF) domain-containing protein n=1 Tax=Novosphingobium mathurense TaxID=428990 RepID=A0A1U6HI76_9SPHN|nr:EAL domain-containing protein [Novosphingobium mathurense]SLJ95472.1 PAS domain S-box-containing protein/diguanylate cyclase (GGDEF) domain-containing protein [Novosphingobium mathurense]